MSHDTVLAVRAHRAVISLSLALTLLGAGCQASDQASPKPKPTTPSPQASPAQARDIALVRAGQVQISSGRRPLRSVAPVTADAAVLELAWSADGKWLAWLEQPEGEGGLTVTLAAVATGVVHRWPGCTCAWLAFRGSDLLSDGGQGAALLNYPQDGSAAKPWKITGLPGKDPAGLAEPLLSLVGGGADEVYVGYANGSQSTYGGPQTLYRVDADGQATALDQEQANGTPHLGALSPDGKTLAYQVNTHVDACQDRDGVTLVDIATGKATVPTLPASAGRATAVSTWFDGTGQAWSADLVGLADCTSAEPKPLTQVTAQVFKAVDGKWVATDRKAVAGADVGAGQTAWLTAAVQSNGVQLGAQQPGTLTVEDSSGSPRQVADQVVRFAVAPAAS